MKKIGFMQGRLSPKPADRIQAFPKDTWRDEFIRGRELGFDCIELIYDDLFLEANPLNSTEGRSEILTLVQQTGLVVSAICADYFMPCLLENHVSTALHLLDISKELKCPLVEFPFVGNASLHCRNDRHVVIDALSQIIPHAKELGLKIALETDLAPNDFLKFLNNFSSNIVGANLDIGNSAMWGWDVQAECRGYGDRIFNVHIKDGVFGASTVPLGTGHTDFKRAFEGLRMAKYTGDFILQTAPDPDYIGVAVKYKDFTKKCMEWL